MKNFSHAILGQCLLIVLASRAVAEIKTVENLGELKGLSCGHLYSVLETIKHRGSRTYTTDIAPAIYAFLPTQLISV